MTMYRIDGFAVFSIWLNVPAIKKSESRYSTGQECIEPCFEINDLRQESPFCHTVQEASQHLVKIIADECDHRKRTRRFVIAPIFYDYWHEEKTEEGTEEDD